MKAADFYARFRSEASKAIVGQDEAVRLCALALIAQSHVLLEGVPGVGKTLLAKTIARLLSVQYGRVQFTPDLMPADIVGTSVYDLQSRSFRVRQGPVFTNILLADEINRAPAKVQAALLESMEERGVSLEGQQLPLPDPFMVLATQNQSACAPGGQSRRGSRRPGLRHAGRRERPSRADVPAPAVVASRGRGGRADRGQPARRRDRPGDPAALMRRLVA